MCRSSTLCNSCLEDMPYDLKINVGNFHIELHTDAVSRQSLNKLFSNVKTMSNEISKSKKLN